MSIKGIILIEGVDGSGKSTLAKYIAKKFNGQIIHLTYRFPDSMFTYHAAALHRAIKLSSQRLIILDRQWVSEDIYARVYRGGTQCQEAGRIFDRVLRRFGCVYIFCLAGNEWEERYLHLSKHRNEMYKADQKIIEVSERYNKAYFGSKIQEPISTYLDFITMSGGFKERQDSLHYTIEANGYDMKEFCERILTLRKIRRGTQYRAALNTKDYNLLGHSLEAKYLIIGDKINRERRQCHWPWFAHKNSSLFLSKALTDLEITEEELMYTNINDKNGTLHVSNLIKEIGLKPMYLGNAAFVAGNKIGINGSCLYHPSYAKRFNKLDEFKEQLNYYLTG